MIQVNGFDLLKNAIKDDSFVNELRNKYGNEFTNDVIEYFSGKYDNIYMVAKDIEDKIKDKIKEIVNMIYSRGFGGRSSSRVNQTNRGNQGASSSSPSSNTSSSGVSSIDSEDVEHKEGNNFSSELVISVIDEEINKVSSDVESLENAIKEVSIKDKKLREELERKKAFLNILKSNRKQLDVGKSYDESTSKLDEKINSVETELKQTQDELNRLNKLNLKTASSRRRVDIRKGLLEHKIAKLKLKQGAMMSKQRRAVNKKLNAFYKKSNKKANREGSESATTMFREERDTDLTNKKNRYEEDMRQSQIKIRNSGFIGRQVNRINFLISYHKYNLVSKYCTLLRKKDATVDGLRQLPDDVVQVIKNNINTLYSVAGRPR